MDICKASSDMLPEIVAIENECFESPWSEASLRAELRAEKCVFLAACFDGRILGFVIVRVAADECEVYDIAVSKAAQSRGIGAMLLSEALVQAGEYGAVTAYLEVRRSNSAAAALYKKLGFETVGVRKNYYDKPLEDALLMMKGV